MVVTLMYYPGATPTDIPAPNVQPTQRYSVTVDNATRMGTQLILCAPLLWQGETPMPNIVTVEDNATPYKLWYFIDTWNLLTRETFRLTATYSAAMTTLHNDIPINAVCSRFSEGDSQLPSITAEPLLETMAPYYREAPFTLSDYNNQSSVGVVVTMATDTQGRPFNTLPTEWGRPVFASPTPLNSRQPEPISFLLTGLSDDLIFDDAIASLRLLVSDAGTNAKTIQRVQIVPKALIRTLDKVTFLNHPPEGETEVFVAVLGKAVIGCEGTLIYTYEPPKLDYMKAQYYGANITIRSWGSEIAQVPLTPFYTNISFDYSLSTGINPFLTITTGAGKPTMQVPVTLPDITVIGDYYTAWYEANKDQLITQGATAALSVAGSIALAIAAVSSGGSLLAPAIAVGASALNAVNTGLTVNKALKDAANSQQVVGTSPTLPYTNTEAADFISIWSPTVPYNSRRDVCSRFGYASSRILDKLPTYDDSPRGVQCYVAGALQTTSFKPNGVIGVTDHNNALASELASGFTIWYTDNIGDYDLPNRTK